MKVVRILSDRPKWSVFESGHLISVTIRIALVSGNSMLNFYDPNMMNIAIRQKIYCLYPYLIGEFFPRKKNYLYLHPQYPSVSDPFSSLSRAKGKREGGAVRGAGELCFSAPSRPNCARERVLR
jgi:hypothetical protein